MFQKTLEKLLRRATDSHKFSFGHVLVVGGSAGMVGAPLLAAKAALRTGAGLVSVASTQDVTDKLDGLVPELLTHAYDASRLDSLAAFVQDRKVSVLVVGSGMADTTDNGRIVERLIGLGLPTVIDAGALTIVSKKLQSLADNRALLLTPHPGEFQRLVGEDLPTNRQALKDLAHDFAAKHSVTLVLKSQPTLVLRADESYANTTGSPALATAGSGDVVAGMIAALIAQGLDIFEAGSMAVYLHGLAGELAGAAKTEPATIASDVIDCIPQAFSQAGNQ